MESIQPHSEQVGWMSTSHTHILPPKSKLVQPLYIPSATSYPLQTRQYRSTQPETVQIRRKCSSIAKICGSVTRSLPRGSAAVEVLLKAWFCSDRLSPTEFSSLSVRACSLIKAIKEGYFRLTRYVHCLSGCCESGEEGRGFRQLRFVTLYGDGMVDA